MTIDPNWKWQIGRLVDHIAGSAGPARCTFERGGFLVVFCIRDRHRCVFKIGGLPGVVVMDDCRFTLDDASHLVRKLFNRCVDMHLRPGRRQELRFPRGALGPAGHDGSLPGHVEEDRQDAQRLDTRGAWFTRLPGHDLHR